MGERERQTEREVERDRERERQKETEKECGVGRYASMCLASRLGISIYL